MPKVSQLCTMLGLTVLVIFGADAQKTISKPEFLQAFTVNGYPAPDARHYDKLTSPSVKRLANFSSKKEMAMFLANIIHETGGLKNLEEHGGNSLKASYTWANPGTRVNPNKSYHGRGPVQLSHPQNYHDASIAIFGNPAVLIDNPERVLTDKQTGWDTAAWYWGARVGNQSGVKQGKFGSSINAVNGVLECRGQGLSTTATRKDYYSKIFRTWRIAGQPDLSGC